MIPERIRGLLLTGLIAVLVSVLISGLIAAGAAAGPAGEGPAGARKEPVTVADRDLLVRVRLAGLWEMPAGQLASLKGSDQRVRQIGAMIRDQHSELDKQVLAAAAELGVTLPDEPDADQSRWLAELDAASGPQFDQLFVERLRAAHGKVFVAIAAVRAGTRNAVVRRMAQQSNQYVLTHLTMLESTGLVDYQTLSVPAAGAAAVSAPGGLLEGTGLGGLPWAGWVLVVAAFVLGVLRLRRLRRPAARRRRSSVAARAPSPYGAHAAGPVPRRSGAHTLS